MKRNLILLIIAAVSCLWTQAQTFSGGSGTESDPYQIATESDLFSIYTLWGSKTATKGVYFKLTSDITLTKDWTPIGVSNLQFAGVIDGDGHKISGLNIVGQKSSTLGGLTANFAFIAYMAQTGELKNLTFDSPTMTVSANYSSLVVSTLYGKIDNCHVNNMTMTVNSGTSIAGFCYSVTNTGSVTNSSISGTVTTAKSFGGMVYYPKGTFSGNTSSLTITGTAKSLTLGGLVAEGTAAIDNCTFNGKIYAMQGSSVGGIAGKMTGGSVNNCANYGYLEGYGYTAGIVGYNLGATAINDCYNMGTLVDIFYGRDSTDVTTGMDDYVGGIVANSANATTTRCWNGGTIKSIKGAAGIVAYGQKATMTDCYNAGLIYAPTYDMVGGLLGRCLATSGVTLTNCLNYGTLYINGAARTEHCEYYGCTNRDGYVLTNVYFDRQVTGWGQNTQGVKTTEELTSGTALDGFDASVWTFAAGMYPRLTASAPTNEAILCATPFTLASSDVHNKVTSNFTVSTSNNVAWSLPGATLASLSGTTVTVTRGTTAEDVLVQSTLGDYTHQAVVTIYPNLFSGSGTESDPYLITNFTDLKNFSAATNDQHLTFDDEYIKVTADLDLESDATFVPASNDANYPFNGNFDGDNHLIKNWAVSGTENQGFISYVNAQGVISNLQFDASCSLKPQKNFGVLCYSLSGTAQNIRNRAAVTATAGYAAGIVIQIEKGGSVLDCYNEGAITATATSGCIAGIAETSYGTITGCQNSGVITANFAKGSNVGGIVAYNRGVVTECLNNGMVNASYKLGGIAGNTWDNATMTHCLSTGVIKYLSNVDYVDAIAGSRAAESTTFTDVVYDKQITIYDIGAVDGISGKTTSEIVNGTWSGDRWTHTTGLYPTLTAFADEGASKLHTYPVIFADGETRVDMSSNASLYSLSGLTWKLDDGDDFRIGSNALRFTGSASYCSDIVIATYNSYKREIPVGATGNFLSGSGTSDDPWLIATPADLVKLSTQVSKSKLGYTGKVFSVVNDLDMTGITFNPVALGTTTQFDATLNGNNHTISNLSISKTSSTNVGLVGFMGSNGRINDLKIGSGSTIEGYSEVGGLVGNCNGTVFNCVNYATVTGTKGNVGGIVGLANETALLNYCYNYGTISGAAQYVGGVAGAITGDGSTACSRLFNAGTVSSTSTAVGGIVGGLSGSPLIESENFGVISGTSNLVGGIAGDVGTCDSLYRLHNFGTINGKQSVGGITGRYAITANYGNKVLECYNAGYVEATAAQVGGLVGQSTTLTIERSANVGNVTNTAATIKASVAGAGGILGIGAPTLTDCYNAGTIVANNNVGAMVGMPTSTSSAFTVTNCISTGSIDGYGSTNVGALVGRKSTKAVFTNCYYDTQMTNVAAMALADADGVTGLLSRELVATTMTGSTDGAPRRVQGTAGNWTLRDDHYPCLTAMLEEPAVEVCSKPILLADTNTRYNVTANFARCVAENCDWTADSIDEFYFREDGEVFMLKDIDGERVVTVLTETPLSTLFDFGTSTDTTYSHDYVLNILFAYEGNTSVDELTASKTVAAEAVYTLSGARVPSTRDLAPGVYIIVRHYTDGTSKAVKILK